MRLLILLLLFGFAACTQQPKKYVPNKKAIQLEGSAIQLMKVYSSDRIPQDSNYQKAIRLLNEAIKIDSNYYNAYSSKLSLQWMLKQYDNALATAKHLKNLRPNSPDSYVTVGLLYEKLNDTISSYKYFNTAISKYDTILDTMSIKNKMYDVLLMNKGIDLILAGQQIKGNEILKQLYKKSNDDLYKEMIVPFVNKSRKEVFENIFNPKSTTETKITYPK